LRLIFQEKKNSLNYDKLCKCLIQGAEESKNYLFPTLHKTVYNLLDVVNMSDFLIVFYEYAECAFVDLTMDYDVRRTPSISFLCGPEEGFSENEIGQFQRTRVYTVRLHSLILKSIDVIFYAGIVLSALIEKKL